MKLKIFIPSELFLDTNVAKVTGESYAGGFGLLPKHIDFVTALVPGLLAYETDHGKETFLALNGGILVKQGDQVSIATKAAIQGELGALKKAVEDFITDLDEKEKKTRTAVARLEADFIRRFVEFGKNV
jgi:F-type H+-transporting ATPase subunit epsilon